MKEFLSEDWLSLRRRRRGRVYSEALFYEIAAERVGVIDHLRELSVLTAEDFCQSLDEVFKLFRCDVSDALANPLY